MFKERRNISPKASPPKVESLHTKLMGHINVSPKAQDRIIEHSYLKNGTGTTWESHYKENSC